MISTWIKYASSVCLAMSLAGLSHAQVDWPNRPIKFIVPFPPGGATDGISRHLTAKLQEALGQPVIVENIGGMAGGIGMSRLAHAPADGYTIGLAHVGTHAINPHIYPKLGYDPVKDFTPIARLTEYVNVLVVRTQQPFRSVNDIVQAARTKPGGITFGSAGNGSSNHLSAELLASLAGVRFTHVPYKGSAPAMGDLLGGNIDFMFDLMITSQPHIAAGKLRALATTGRTRLRQAPELPTVAESVPGFEVIGWSAVTAPANLPQPIVARLSMEIAKILRSPETVDRFNGQGFEVAYSTPNQLRQLIANDLVFWGPVVKASGARVD